MRYLRSAIAAVIVTAALVAPSSALGEIGALSVSTGALSPEGDSVAATLAFHCHPGWNVAFGGASVAQSTGNRLVRGSGEFFNDFPGVPCTGAPETQDVIVNDESSFPFKPGKASASGELTVFNPSTGRLVTRSTGPTEVRLTKK